MAAVGDAYDRCRTGSTAGRGAVAGWTPCPLCMSSLQLPSCDGNGGASSLSDASIVEILSNLPQTTKSTKQFSHGRGLAAHLHAVHTPWRPGKAELKRRRALRKRMENEQRRLRSKECDGNDDGQCEGQERSRKRRRLLVHDEGDGSGGSQIVVDWKETWDPSPDEIEQWNRRVMQIVALVEYESKRKENLAQCSMGADRDKGMGGARSDDDAKGRDRSGNACLSYRESIPPFLAAAADGDLQALQKCVAGNEALQTAEEDRKPVLDKVTRERAKSLLSLRDRNGSTAEHWAAGGGHLECVAYLLDLRDAVFDGYHEETPSAEMAPEIAQSKRVGRRRDGKTALHYAARNGHNHIIRELLSRNDATHVDVPSGDGTTPLHMACYGGHPSTVRHLIERHGADISLTNEWECGSAHWAAMSLGNAGPEKVIELCAYLKERGVDFTASQRQGHAPLHKAASRKNRHVIEWMAGAFSVEERKAMGKPDVGGNRPSEIWLNVGGEEEFGRWMRDSFGW